MADVLTCSGCGGPLGQQDEACPTCLPGCYSKPVTLVICGAPKCEHDFKGWRQFEDGRGGETVCTKCGMGAMAWSLRTGL